MIRSNYPVAYAPLYGTLQYRSRLAGKTALVRDSSEEEMISQYR